MKKQSYKELKQRLDEIIEKMQNPETDLDEMLSLHKEGEKIIQSMQEYLKEIDKKISNAKE